MPPSSLAVVLPAHNEEEGIVGFLTEVREAIEATGVSPTFVVVDDLSTDGTVAALEAAAANGVPVTVIRSAVNRGHGPTALAAWRAGLESGAEAILHVDGDGQFLGEDFPRVLAALDGDGVRGSRTQRTDPWFRKALTTMVKGLTAVVAGAAVPDVNTPLRVYSSAALAKLLAVVPEDALVPHVHFSINEKRLGLHMRDVTVRSIPRRGSVATGTMWGAAPKAPKLPPRRLVRFARKALAEVVRIDILRRP